MVEPRLGRLRPSSPRSSSVDGGKRRIVFYALAFGLALLFVASSMFLPSSRTTYTTRSSTVDPYLKLLREYRISEVGEGGSGGVATLNDQFEIFRMTGCAIYESGFWSGREVSVREAFEGLVGRSVPVAHGVSSCMVLSGNGDGVIPIGMGFPDGIDIDLSYTVPDGRRFRYFFQPCRGLHVSEVKGFPSSPCKEGSASCYCSADIRGCSTIGYLEGGWCDEFRWGMKEHLLSSSHKESHVVESDASIFGGRHSERRGEDQRQGGKRVVLSAGKKKRDGDGHVLKGEGDFVPDFQIEEKEEKGNDGGNDAEFHQVRFTSYAGDQARAVLHYSGENSTFGAHQCTFHTTLILECVSAEQYLSRPKRDDSADAELTSPAFKQLLRLREEKRSLREAVQSWNGTNAELEEAMQFRRYFSLKVASNVFGHPRVSEAHWNHPMYGSLCDDSYDERVEEKDETTGEKKVTVRRGESNDYCRRCFVVSHPSACEVDLVSDEMSFAFPAIVHRRHNEGEYGNRGGGGGAGGGWKKMGRNVIDRVRKTVTGLPATAASYLPPLGFFTGSGGESDSSSGYRTQAGSQPSHHIHHEDEVRLSDGIRNGFRSVVGGDGKTLTLEAAVVGQKMEEEGLKNTLFGDLLQMAMMVNHERAPFDMEMGRRAQSLRDHTYHSFFHPNSDEISSRFQPDEAILADEETVAFVIHAYSPAGTPIHKKSGGDGDRMGARIDLNTPFFEAEVCVGTRTSIDDLVEIAEGNKGKNLGYGGVKSPEGLQRFCSSCDIVDHFSGWSIALCKYSSLLARLLPSLERHTSLTSLLSGAGKMVVRAFVEGREISNSPISIDEPSLQNGGKAKKGGSGNGGRGRSGEDVHDHHVSLSAYQSNLMRNLLQGTEGAGMMCVGSKKLGGVEKDIVDSVFEAGKERKEHNEGITRGIDIGEKEKRKQGGSVISDDTKQRLTKALIEAGGAKWGQAKADRIVEVVRRSEKIREDEKKEEEEKRMKQKEEDEKKGTPSATPSPVPNQSSSTSSSSSVPVKVEKAGVSSVEKGAKIQGSKREEREGGSEKKTKQERAKVGGDAHENGGEKDGKSGKKVEKVAAVKGVEKVADVKGVEKVAAVKGEEKVADVKGVEKVADVRKVEVAVDQQRVVKKADVVSKVEKSMGDATIKVVNGTKAGKKGASRRLLAPTSIATSTPPPRQLNEKDGGDNEERQQKSEGSAESDTKSQQNRGGVADVSTTSLACVALAKEVCEAMEDLFLRCPPSVNSKGIEGLDGYLTLPSTLDKLSTLDRKRSDAFDQNMVGIYTILHSLPAWMRMENHEQEVVPTRAHASAYINAELEMRDVYERACPSSHSLTCGYYGNYLYARQPRPFSCNGYMHGQNATAMAEAEKNGKVRDSSRPPAVVVMLMLPIFDPNRALAELSSFSAWMNTAVQFKHIAKFGILLTHSPALSSDEITESLQMAVKDADVLTAAMTSAGLQVGIGSGFDTHVMVDDIHNDCGWKYAGFEPRLLLLDQGVTWSASAKGEGGVLRMLQHEVYPYLAKLSEMSNSDNAVKSER